MISTTQMFSPNKPIMVPSSRVSCKKKRTDNEMGLEDFRTDPGGEILQNQISKVTPTFLPNQSRTFSPTYLQNHTIKNSENAIANLKKVADEAMSDIRNRCKFLHDGVQKRKDDILRSVNSRGANNSADSLSKLNGEGVHSENSFKSSRFQFMQQRNVVKTMYGDKPDDYKEFMFFDKDSARHLKHAICTLGDPSFNISYSREFSGIALQPIIFGSGGKRLGEFYGPTAVDTDMNHQIYVCDSSNCRIVVYSDQLVPLYSVGQKGKGKKDFDRPSSVAVDHCGSMYIADSFNDRVSVYTTDGSWKFNVGGAGKLNKPRGVSVTNDGEIFVVSDTGNQRIQVYSGNGTYKGSFGKLGMKQGEFVRPQGIRISNDQKVYVSDTWNYRIEVFDIEGRRLRSIGKRGSGPGEFEEPRAVAIDTNGNVLVTDTSKNNLQIFDKHGTFIREYGQAGSGTHEFSSPEGVHTDQINRIFVADRKNNRVHIL